MSLPKDFQWTFTKHRAFGFNSAQTPNPLSSARIAAHLTDVIPCVATVWVCFQWRHLTSCVAHSQPSKRSIRNDADCCFTRYLHVMRSGTNWGKEKPGIEPQSVLPVAQSLSQPTSHAIVSRTERERSSCPTQNKFSRLVLLRQRPPYTVSYSRVCVTVCYRIKLPAAFI
jgi:hypothetical protein